MKVKEMNAPNITITFNKTPLTVTYNYARDEWTVHDDNKLIREVYTELLSQAINSTSIMFRPYSPHPRLDVLEEISKEWDFKITGMEELRLWLSKPKDNQDENIVY